MPGTDITAPVLRPESGVRTDRLALRTPGPPQRQQHGRLSLNRLHGTEVADPEADLVSAADDPFLPREVLDEVRVAATWNAALRCEFPDAGGHVGFIAGTLPWRRLYWAECRVMEFLSTHLAPAREAPPL